MATATFPRPTAFDLAHPQEWLRWEQRFLRYRETTGLDKKEGEIQISTITLTLSAAEKDFAAVVEKLEQHFIKKRNIIYERACFNQRSRREGEPVDDFITSLYKLSEHRQFGALRDLIRDRIVVGLRDTRLSEKLQVDGDLTLGKAVTAARQSEAVKQQQKSLRNSSLEESMKEISAVHSKIRSPKKQEMPEKQTTKATRKPQSRKADAKSQSKEPYGRCGRVPSHS